MAQALEYVPVQIIASAPTDTATTMRTVMRVVFPEELKLPLLVEGAALVSKASAAPVVVVVSVTSVDDRELEEGGAGLAG